MKVAYLVNQYPKVSHTFVRREILALEELGIDVSRYTVRRVNEVLKDPADEREAERTRVILGEGVKGLLKGVAKTAIKHPIKFARAAARAVKMGVGSDRGVVLHGAYFAEACVLREWLEQEGVDHVHAHFGTNSTTVALLVRELGGPTYSFTVHGPEEFDKPGALSLGDKIHESKFVAGVSSFGRSQLYRQVGAGDWSKVQVVRCGVDDGYLAADAPPPSTGPRLVCVGRLCEQKGQVLLVEAVARVAKAGIPVELVLVGDGEMRKDIEQVIAREGIEKNVRITGWASGEVVRNELLAARALVLPSFAEGLPVAIMEALALGRPVLSTYIAGIPELVEPGQSGWLVPAGSIEALERALREVLAASPEELARLGNEGRRRVRAQHDIRVSARALAKLFGATPGDRATSSDGKGAQAQDGRAPSAE